MRPWRVGSVRGMAAQGPRLYQHVSREPKWSHTPDLKGTSLILETEPDME